MNVSAIYDQRFETPTLLRTHCCPEFILLSMPPCKGGEDGRENRGIGEHEHCVPQELVEWISCSQFPASVAQGP